MTTDDVYDPASELSLACWWGQVHDLADLHGQCPGRVFHAPTMADFDCVCEHHQDTE